MDKNKYVTRDGEVIYYYTRKFWKFYRKDFLKALSFIDSKELKIFIYICENVEAGTNKFAGTYAKIAKDVKVSQPTIAKVMKNLQKEECKFIRKVQNGLWLVNPNILMQGDDEKRQHLLYIFNSENPIDELTYARKK